VQDRYRRLAPPGGVQEAEGERAVGVATAWR
jgi:hypothetical protein